MSELVSADHNLFHSWDRSIVMSLTSFCLTLKGLYLFIELSRMDQSTAPATTSSSSTARTDSARKSKIYNDLEEMMYGFGDTWPPDPQSVELLEQLVVEYIEDLTAKAVNIAEMTGKLDKDCFMYLVRKDRKKFNRVHQLLTTNDYIKKAKEEISKELT